MEYDAFTAGVELGGLINTKEIKLLVCYMLSSVDKPIGRQHILEMLQYEGLANYFEVGQAISELQEKGNIALINEETEEYTATETGRAIAKTLESSLPFLVRQKAVRAAMKLLARIKLEQENKVTIEKSSGGYTVTCTVLDNERVLMSSSLLVPDSIQAEVVKRQFLDAPLKIYSGTIALLTGDFEAVKSQFEDEKK